ncbi:hypothetical protein LAZ67_3004916 [Cordylochernes scorpioides]|uniref:Uncharacterized protein n=1 Tax=Cordylochernes scorpioides TaxID=51811 RepID=A0ABY6KB62_9ARAC|nr:hypothetical protein LAZ67_3004916 [Cordylochernes scorpioides]
MFSEGREDVNDEKRAGHPSTSTTDEKINEVEKMILANRRITVREVAEDLNISIGSCHSIFINDLGMRWVAAKFVPKLLNCDQKQHRMNIANEMLDSVRDDPNLLHRVITGYRSLLHRGAVDEVKVGRRRRATQQHPAVGWSDLETPASIDWPRPKHQDPVILIYSWQRAKATKSPPHRVKSSIRKFWELEDVPISKAQLGTKNACEILFKSNLKRDIEGDGVKDSEAEPKGDGVKDSEAKPKGEGVKDSEAEPKGDGVKDSEAKPKGDGVKDSETAIKGYESVNNSQKRKLKQIKLKIIKWLIKSDILKLLRQKLKMRKYQDT